MVIAVGSETAGANPAEAEILAQGTLPSAHVPRGYSNHSLCVSVCYHAGCYLVCFLYVQSEASQGSL